MFLFLLNSESMEAERALIEERYEDKITNLQKHLKKFYSQELKVRLSNMSDTFSTCSRGFIALSTVDETLDSSHSSSQERDQEIEALSAAVERKDKGEEVPTTAPQGDSEGLRRSQRLTSQAELGRLRADLDQCRAELFSKTQGKVTALTLNRRFKIVNRRLTCSIYPHRANKAETAAGSVRFSRRPHQRRGPQAAGGSAGRPLLKHHKSTSVPACGPLHPRRCTFILSFCYRICDSSVWTCRGWDWACSLVKEPAVATQEESGCGTR